MSRTGLLFNIQRYSLHDGPGIRTVVFLKGCPLRCRWCSNPESQLPYPQLFYQPGKCIGQTQCGACGPRCPRGAIRFGADGTASIDRTRCDNCLECAAHCPAKAIRAEGYWKSVDEILEVVEQESVFCRDGQGGLTVSGGEPLAQGEFLNELLAEAKRRRIHTALETCGYGAYDNLRRVAAHLDFLLYDVKTLNPARHREFTGFDNTVILENLRRLSADFPNLKKLIRTPVIPGFNNSVEELRPVRELVDTLSNAAHQLLPYHSYGRGKYDALGVPYPMGDVKLGGGALDNIEMML